MAALVKTAKLQCPSSKIVLSGYSQGAMVVHNALKSGVSSADVAGTVVFGDPLKTQPMGDLAQAKTKSFCASADSICGTGNDLQGSHLSYGSVAGEAADFIVGVVGGK
jgi:predicted esterase